MAQTESSGLKSFDMQPLVSPGADTSVHWPVSDRMPLTPPAAAAAQHPAADAAPKQLTADAAALRPAAPTLEMPPPMPVPGPTYSPQADNSYYHTLARAGATPQATPTADGHSQYTGLLPRTGKADPYYNGAIPRTRVLDGVGNVADVGLPALTALGANALVRHRYDQSYAAAATQPEMADLQMQTDLLQATIRQAYRPELDRLTVQMRNLARQTHLNPADDTTWLRMNQGALTTNEQNIYDRWVALRFPRTNPAMVRQASQATNDPAIRNALVEREAFFTEAQGIYQTQYRAADALATAMRRDSLAALGVGELANFAVDRTLFKDTPHSLRTTLTDCGAPLVVFSRMPWQAKLGIIVGAHLINRYIDSHTDGVGEF